MALFFILVCKVLELITAPNCNYANFSDTGTSIFTKSDRQKLYDKKCFSTLLRKGSNLQIKKSVFFPLIFTVSYIFSGIHKLLDLLQ